MWKWSVATTATVLNSDSQLGVRKSKLVPAAAAVNSYSSKLQHLSGYIVRCNSDGCITQIQKLTEWKSKSGLLRHVTLRSYQHYHEKHTRKSIAKIQNLVWLNYN